MTVKKGAVPFLVGVLLLGGAAPGTVSADRPEVRWVELNREARSWRITVTLDHHDEADYHFMDRVQIRTADGKVLGEEDFHTPRPQAAERITTLRDIRVPTGVTTIYVRAYCTLEGWGHAREIDLTEPMGNGYRIRTDVDW